MESTYLVPMGERWEGYPRRDPESFAALLGATLQSQERHLQEHMEYERQFAALREEAVLGLRQLATALDNRNPRTGGELTGTALELNFYRGLNGALNQSIRDSLGVDPAAADLKMFLQVVDIGQDSPPPNPAPLHDGDRDSIELLGQRPEDMETPGANCPPSSADMYVKVDNNDNPGDDTYLDCTYDSGKIRYQLPMVDGKRHGLYLAYSIRDGMHYLSRKQRFVDDKAQGVARIYCTSSTYRNGTEPYLCREDRYEYGKQEGVSKGYSVTQDGHIYTGSKETYAAGQLHGPYELYSYTPTVFRNRVPAGTVYRSMTVSYEHGKKHGAETWYEPDGSVRSVSHYVNGQRAD
jgi:antitoxin component YwqK of YwqJK toxin-antitoxin module